MLRRQGAKNKLNPKKWRQKDIIVGCIDRVGKSSFNMFERILRAYVKNRDQNISGGFFKLGMIIGHYAETSKGDVKKLWDRMINIYGNDENSIAIIKKILGTLLMIIVAEDERPWVWEPDPEKKDKLDKGEKPDSNIYYVDHQLKKYTIQDLHYKFNRRK